MAVELILAVAVAVVVAALVLVCWLDCCGVFLLAQPLITIADTPIVAILRSIVFIKIPFC
jgi:hypothetical protein